MDLLEKASVILTPTAYNNGEALCVKPSDGSGDFDFSRNSAATRVNAQGLVENVQILSSNLVQNGDFSEEGAEEVSNGSFSQEGAEEVTNGNFDTDLSGWQVIDSATGIDITWTENGVSFITDGAGGGIQQSVMTIGKYYLIEFDYTAISGGIQLSPYFGSIDETKRYSGIFEATTTNISFYRNNSFGNTEGLIDNVSVREVAQNWTLGTGWSIAEDKATVDNTVNANLDQTCLTSGKTYKVSFEISDLQVGGNITIGDTASPSTYTATSNGVQTFYFTPTQSVLRVRGKGYPCSITNISVKEVGMDWNLQTGWEISENKLNCLGSSSQIEASTLLNFDITKKYKLVFTISGVDSGSRSFRVYTQGSNGGVIFSYTPHINGTYEYYYDPSINGTKLAFQTAFNQSTFSIDDVSVIEITDDTNLPRINYEGFSYQDDLGSEEVVNGTFDTDLNNWVTYGGTLISWESGGYALLDSNGGYWCKIKQSNVFEIGKTYKVTLTAKSNRTDLNFHASPITGSFSQADTFETFDQYYTATTTSFVFGYSNAGSATITIDNVSVKEYLGQSVVPNSGCGSWLFESQSTNTIIDSNSNFLAFNMDLIYNNVKSPDGTQNAFKATTTTTSGAQFRPNQTITTPSTFSIFLKYGNNQWYQVINSSATGFYANIDVENGVFGTSGADTDNLSVKDYGNGWYRFSGTFTSASTNGGIRVYASSSSSAGWAGVSAPIGSYVYGYGFQVEALNYATSYIPTSGSQVTRNQDVCTNGGTGTGLINSTEGVLYAEVAALNNNLSGYIGIYGASNSRIRITFTNQIKAQLFNGSYQVNMGSTQIATNMNKIAFKYKENDFALWINGVEVATDTSGLTFSANTLSYFNLSGYDGTSNIFLGKTKAVAVWKEALSDSELQSLTTI